MSKQTTRLRKFMFSDAKTYADDLKLFEELGLKKFHTTDNAPIFLGEYRLPHYDKANVKVTVTCMPAQFWTFIVETDEDRIFEIETGSGSLSKYWPSIIQVAEGCLEVKTVKE